MFNSIVSGKILNSQSIRYIEINPPNIYMNIIIIDKSNSPFSYFVVLCVHLSMNVKFNAKIIFFPKKYKLFKVLIHLRQKRILFIIDHLLKS